MVQLLQNSHFSQEAIPVLDPVTGDLLDCADGASVPVYALGHFAIGALAQNFLLNPVNLIDWQVIFGD